MKNLWCICTAFWVKNEVTGKFEVHQKDFYEDTINDFIEFSSGFKYLSGHNIISYDIPALKVLGYEKEFKVDCLIDTLILSSLSNSVRDIMGADGQHSLGSWGARFNFPKGDFKDFEGGFSEEMLKYCRQDVALNAKVLTYLALKEGDFPIAALDLEQRVQMILNRQKEVGVRVDVEKAMLLFNQLDGTRQEIEALSLELFPPVKKNVRTVSPVYKKNGALTERSKKYGFVDGDKEPKEVFDLEPFNLGSTKQVKELLDQYGWDPVDYTPKGSPKLTEENLETLPDDVPEPIKRLKEYFMVKSKATTVSKWFEAMRNDDRVHGTVKSLGAKTHRMGHTHPNMANIPRVGKKYGKEFRECFIPSDGRKLVGVDAANIQLRVLAHHMEDPMYIKLVDELDVHQYNADILGVSRDTAKTFIYAWVLGAGDAKVGSIIGGNKSAGKKAKDRFVEAIPALKGLERKRNVAVKQGYFVGLDGRRIPVTSKHLSLSVFLQGDESILMKRALLIAYVDLCKAIGKNSFDFVLNVHDEWQIEVSDKYSEQARLIAMEAIKKAGEYYSMRCPLKGDGRVGKTWADTH